MTRSVPAVLLVLTCAACEEAEPFLPTVAFEGMALRDISWDQANVDFEFRVENPNPVAVSLSSFDYNLNLETIDFLSGDSPDGLDLEPSGSSPLVLPLDLVYENVWGAVEATRGEDLIDFALSGQMGFNTPLGEVMLPYNEGGDFPALRTPKLSIQGARVPQFNITTATLEIDLGVDNPHGTSLLFDGFAFDLALNDRSVSSTAVPFDVPGDSVSTISIPVEVQVVDLGLALFGALTTGQPLDLGMSATVDVTTPFGVLPLTIDETGNLAAEILP
ncbi:MAG: LEA type 2 family protein [Myxococcales bacterium]|nr:LEA type 2 family protein [Myxococcales bacterium]